MRCESEISKIRLRDEVRAHFDVLRVKGGGGSTKSGLHRFGPWLLLNFVVMLWSSDECLIKHMLDTGKARSPAFLNASRFTVAALVFLPWGPAAPWKAGMRDLWASGAELGLWMFIGFATQAIGLQYTTVSRSAFLLYLNVVLVPVIGSVLFNHTIRWTTWASVALACLGTILLGYDGGKPNVGDAWCLAAAVSSALFILRLEAAAQKHSAAALNCASMLVVAALCLIWLVATAGFNSLKPTLQEAGTALYLGCVPTALCSFLQTVGQREIEVACPLSSDAVDMVCMALTRLCFQAESAAIIYALDPVYTAILGALVRAPRAFPRQLSGSIHAAG